jgi:hypothetical protein
MVADAFLTWSPLISVAVWFSISGYLIVHQQYRTWTERFFVAICLCAGAYALSDFVFFSIGVPQNGPFDAAANPSATFAASASLASITLAGLFLFLYGLSMASRFRRRYLLAVLPTAFFVLSFPLVMFEGFAAPTTTSPVIAPVYRQAWLLPWLLFVGALWIIGLVGITKTFFEIRRLNPKLANRIGAILAGLAIAVVAGATTNALVAINALSLPPLFSTFLAIPGVLILFAVTPTSLRSFNDAILRRRASEYDVKGAFLTFSDGTLIGSRTAPEEEMIDADSFSATLDVIQNFMRTSFPTLRGKWLRSIRHGDYTLVMEPGRYAYLTLIISGTENDQLRRRMIEHLEDFEADNAPMLETWRGMATDAIGVDRMLDALLSGIERGRNQA